MRLLFGGFPIVWRVNGVIGSGFEAVRKGGGGFEGVVGKVVGVWQACIGLAGGMRVRGQQRERRTAGQLSNARDGKVLVEFLDVAERPRLCCSGEVMRDVYRIGQLRR